MLFDVVAPLYDGTKATAEKLVDWTYTLYHTLFPDATGNDYVTAPQVVSGLGSIDWTNEQGVKTTVSAPFTLTNYATDGYIFFATDGVTLSLSNSDPTQYSGSISYNTYRGEYLFTPTNGALVATSVAPSFIGYRSALRTSNYTVPYFYGQTSGTGSDYAFKLVQSNFSTLKNDNKASTNLPNAGDNVQLNTIKNNLIVNLNEDYPDSTQNPDDFPDYDEWLEEQEETTESTEPTEPSGGGNNYINNGNLYWNSGDGTQNIYEMDADVTETVETFDNYENELKTLEFETLPAVTENANTLEVASSMVEGGLSMLPTGFLDIIMPASIFCAVISMLIRR